MMRLVMFFMAYLICCFFLQAWWHLNRCKSLFVLKDIEMSPLLIDFLNFLKVEKDSERTGIANTLSAIKINVLLFTCAPVSFLSRLEGIWMKAQAV